MFDSQTNHTILSGERESVGLSFNPQCCTVSGTIGFTGKKLYLCPTTCWLIHGDFCSYLSNQIRHWELIRTPVFSKQSTMDIQRGFACLPSPCFFLPRVNGQIKHVVSVKNSDPEPRKLWFLDRSIGMVWVSDCVTGKMFWKSSRVHIIWITW